MTSDLNPNEYDMEQSTDDPEVRVEQLTVEIDETRGDLTETIQAIGEKLEPANLAREAGQTVRDTTFGKVDQMTQGAQETWRDVRTGNAGSLVDSIKSNPIPAGMVALGIGMLFMNRGQSSQGGGSRSFNYGSSLPGGDYGRSSWEQSRWDQRSGGGSPIDKVGSTVSGAAGQAGQTVGQMADQAGQTMSQVADNVGQTASQVPQQAGYMVQQGSSQVRRFMDQNPLGAGIIAVAAGATLGMLLPTTQIEREKIGQTRDQLIGQAESTVHQALDKADEQMEQQGQQ
jgi:ElaB/YqjD/DUF883 family membrane-anchored ribosome-binding protein